MAAHASEEPTQEPSTGAGLLPIFTLAVVIAMVAIGALIAVPSTFTVIAALAIVIAFAAGLVALLGRLMGPDQH